MDHLAILAGDVPWGTGQKLTRATIIVAGVASLVASLLSIVVPIYSISSWCSIISLKLAMFIDPIRDVYEAFTIYTFFQLLINFLGGERALIIMTHGRRPVHHLWPLNHVLPDVDISDPHTFLAVKRGILQYAWLKPVLGLAAIIMKATGTYQESYISLTSGYLWSAIAYNISVTVSLYSLGMFWVCMSQDLQPFRPVPKFLCIKLIIFASYWQGFFLSILVWLGAIPDNVEGYTPDNLAAAIQDALICIEMPVFAVAHWYAFSWHDYVDNRVSAARMPILYAIRDAFGIRDLIEDTKETFSGNQYEYRLFDSGDNVLAHEGSSSRVARMMEGMRYERGGKGKYWIPRPNKPSSRTPLLAGLAGPSHPNIPPRNSDRYMRFGNEDIEESGLDPDEESLYEAARELEFGDYNYHVITAYETQRMRWFAGRPVFPSWSVAPRLSQSTGDDESRLESNVQVAVQKVARKNQSKQKKSSTHARRRDSGAKGKQAEEAEEPLLKGTAEEELPDSSSSKSDRGQRVDLIVEDRAAEEREREQARRAGNVAGNDNEHRKFVQAYPKDGSADSAAVHNQDEFTVGEDEDNADEEGEGAVAINSDESRLWEQGREADMVQQPQYGLTGEEFENVWDGERARSDGP
ncbi:hypothetical protein OIDMADRAFT_100175 [Oidiodendron maius Zn]|uniref:DUF300-domain-containing protein n=1 Tax=Oidiodendron maius (strain Zn) TaxID=913774 RepID=A0A0C3HZV1_OIDMZ|nr:hypothetical protein OIDMADRAFT_100175 [Oidiodendron maius Zn]